jgi:hypothetical protein
LKLYLGITLKGSSTVLITFPQTKLKSTKNLFQGSNSSFSRAFTSSAHSTRVVSPKSINLDVMLGSHLYLTLFSRSLTTISAAATTAHRLHLCILNILMGLVESSGALCLSEISH